MSYQNNALRYNERISFSGVEGISLKLPPVYDVISIYDYKKHFEDNFEIIVNELVRIRQLVHNHESRLKVNEKLYPVIIEHFSLIGGGNNILYAKFNFDKFPYEGEKRREIRKIIEGLFVTGEITINNR